MFYKCIKAIEELKSIEKRKQENKTTIVQKQFHSDKFMFSKQFVNGTLGKENFQPSYNKKNC